MFVYFIVRGLIREGELGETGAVEQVPSRYTVTAEEFQSFMYNAGRERGAPVSGSALRSADENDA